MSETTTPETTTQDAGPVTAPETTAPETTTTAPETTPAPETTTAGGQTIKASGDATAQQPEQDDQGGFLLTVQEQAVQEGDTILPVLAAGEGTAGISVTVGAVRQGEFDLHFQSASGASPQNVGVHYFVIGA